MSHPRRSPRWDPERTKGYSDAVLGIVATILVVPLTNIPRDTINAISYNADVTLASTLSSQIQVRRGSRVAVHPVLCPSAASRLVGQVVPMLAFPKTKPPHSPPPALPSSPYSPPTHPTPPQVRSFLIFWAVFIVIVFAWMRHARAFDGLEGVDGLLVTANWLELLAISSLPFFATTAAATTVASGGKTDAVPDLSLNILMIAATHCLFLFMAIWYNKDRSAAIR